jgi:hypothetical protein
MTLRYNLRCTASPLYAPPHFPGQTLACKVAVRSLIYLCLGVARPGKQVKPPNPIVQSAWPISQGCLLKYTSQAHFPPW